jgi:hypothetical protein
VLQGVGGLGAHRTQRVRELVQERGAELLLLPSYSPDLNPIEEACNKAVNSGVGMLTVPSPLENATGMAPSPDV